MHEWNTGGGLAGQQWNILLDVVVTNIKYKKITSEHAIYIKIFSGRKVSYLMVYTDDFLNTTNNNIAYPDLRRVLKKILILNYKKDISLGI